MPNAGLPGRPAQPARAWSARAARLYGATAREACGEHAPMMEAPATAWASGAAASTQAAPAGQPVERPVHVQAEAAERPAGPAAGTAGRRTRSDRRSAGCRDGRTARAIPDLQSARSCPRPRFRQPQCPPEGRSIRGESGSPSSRLAYGSSDKAPRAAGGLRRRRLRSPERARRLQPQPRCRSRDAGRPHTGRPLRRTASAPAPRPASSTQPRAGPGRGRRAARPRTR